MPRRRRVAAASVALAAGLVPAPGYGAAAVVEHDEPFLATIEPISSALAEEMTGVSWHPGCPVSLADLRLISMPHWGFDGEIHDGELVVHANVAADVVSVFAAAFKRQFPIRTMERIEAYDGDDDASMAADNTTAFNCRAIDGTDRMSVHSWGLAIDINPRENPWIRGDRVDPPAGADYLDRDDVRPGMITDGDFLVTAFAEIGFAWGGHWRNTTDLHHFEAPERAERSDPPDAVAPGAGRPCADGADVVPAGWTGDVGGAVDHATGDIDAAVLAEFIASVDPAVLASPCRAARALLHLDPPPSEEWTVIEVEPAGPAATTVTVTFDGLLDDSTRAVRYTLQLEHGADGVIVAMTAAWSQRCQPGRGHQDFSAELCI